MSHAFALSGSLSSAFEAGAGHAAQAVISGAWEGLLLVVITALLLRVVPGTSARLRFGIWTMVFLLLAMLPLANGFHPGPEVDAAIATSPLRVDLRWSYALAALWLAAVVLRLGHLGLQAVRLRRLWMSAIPVANEALESVSVPLGKVQVCISAELDRPSVIGFFAPRILIPDWLFGQLTDGELQQLVLHEMEHLRRRDDWMNLLQKVGLVLFPLNPALLWIDRRLATERELACDDGVLSQTHAPRAYATCLTSLAERRMAKRRHGRVTALALGALGVVRRSDFSRRIESILSRRPNLNPAAARFVVVGLAAGVLGVAGVLAHAPNLVAFGPSGQQVAKSVAPMAILPVLAARSSRASVAAVQAVSDRQSGSARMQDAVFHPAAAPTNLKAVRPVISRSHKALPAEPKARLISDETDVNTDFASGTQRKLVVMTSWQEPVAIPVIVTLPDGRAFFATYTATPSHAGWIVFQL